jgi:predicted kinase
MRRLPDDRRLDVLVGRGRATPSLAAQLGQHLARLHRRAPGGPSLGKFGRPTALLAAWRDNLETLAGFVGPVLSAGELARLRAAGKTFVDRYRGLLNARVRDGHIRDVHGDLHAENVYVTGRGGRGVVLLDCLEFSDRLRCCDVASDLAFLVMDLERRGAGDFAAVLTASYRQTAGDGDLPVLLPFYRAYRATVRAKVAVLLAGEPEVEDAARTAAIGRAREYVRLALRAAWEAGPPVLIVCAGLSGSGKSTLARAIAEETGFPHLNSDVIRKELQGLPATASGTAVPGFYGAAMSARTYATVLLRADDALRAGRSVVVDATFLRAGYRAEALRVAAAADAAAIVLECRAEAAAIEARLRGRTPTLAHGSDADVAVYRNQRRFAPRDAAVPGLDRIIVHTDASPDDVAERTLAALWGWRQAITAPASPGLRLRRPPASKI